MGAHKGNKGRPPGSKNVKTKRVEDIAERLGVDPFEILCLFAKGDYKTLGYESELYFFEKADGSGVKAGYVISPDLRASCAKDACKYIYSPKRSLDEETEAKIIKVIVEDYSKKAKE
jgi:hypothetical protein